MIETGILTGKWFLYMGAAVILLFTGLYCLLVMRNLIKLLIGLEVFSKGISLAIIATGQANGRIMTAQSLMITFIVIEVSVVSVALALVINFYKHTGSLDVRDLTKLKG